MDKILVLGIGNLLMGNEGIGIHVVQYLQKKYNLENTDIIDGGTGGFHLLDYFHSYKIVLLIDATIDGKPAGTVDILYPKYSSDYPPTLTAHDIGLKDLLDSLYLLDKRPDITLFTVSIPPLDSVSLELSREVKSSIPKVAELVSKKVKELMSQD